jgi:hypothetical protein
MTTREAVILDDTRTSIAEAEAHLARLRGLENRLLGKTAVVCRKCKASHEIEALTYIQTHWYVRPYGCTGGDYYNAGDGQWDCPLCGVKNRLYDKPEIMALRARFRATLECYCTQDHSCCSDPTPCDACSKVGRTRDGVRK